MPQEEKRPGSLEAKSGRAAHSALVLFVLKGLNFALSAVSNFVLAYVLVRTIGLESYAVIASLLAVAALVLQTDLGITGLAFFRLRSHYLGSPGQTSAHGDDRDLVVTVVTIYIGIGLVSVIVLAVTVAAGLVKVAPYAVAYVLIFSGAVSALPRMALRVAINARDGFIWTEVVDLVRRAAILGATIAMLLGISFTVYGVLNLGAWLLSTAAMIWLAGRYGFWLERGALHRGLRLLRGEMSGIRATVFLSLADFVITVYPYYLLAVIADAAAIVAFDMFYKVSRFAVMSYMIASETALPQQTRAVHQKDASRLARVTLKSALVSMLPMVTGVAATALFGERLFAILLNHDAIVTPVMRLAIAAMLVFTLVQTTCQIALIGVGRFEELARRAGITLAGMVLISVLTMLFSWSLDSFMIGYVIVYGAGSLLYAECFLALGRSLAASSFPARIGQDRAA